MSSADLFEDGFPHGTKEGYEKGCRGHGSCPGVLDFGRSCSQASIAYAGDYAYKKRVDAGLTPAEIAELERADGVRPVKLSQSATVVSAPTVNVADSVEPLGDLASDLSVEAVAELAAIPVMVAGIPLDKHGTPAGYSLGCRLRDACPAKASTGVSCANAVAAQQRERKAAREGVRPEEPVKVAEPVVVEAAVESRVDLATGDLAGKLAESEALVDRLRGQLLTKEQNLIGAESKVMALTAQVNDLESQLGQVITERNQLEKVIEVQPHLDELERAAAPVPSEVPRHGASLQVRQLGDAFAFDISGGGEAVRLDLTFDQGQLQRAAVTTGV